MRGAEGQVVLITGGRSPVALEMSRVFARAGDRVIVAESSGGFLCRSSRYVDRFYHVPSSRYRRFDYIDSLVEIVEVEGVDLLVPTCEEIFYISKFKERFAGRCRVLATDFEMIESLHRKDRFVELARELGLRVPRTRAFCSVEVDGFEASELLIVKPVYSRFGGEAFVAQNGELVVSGEERDWIVQEYLEGAELHSYAVAVDGRVLADVVYRSLVNEHGTGPSLAFEAVKNSGVEEWVRRFVGGTGFSGQIAFDFIVGADGVAAAIECNPRSTSGLHLLAETEGIYLALSKGIASEGHRGGLKAKGLRLPCLLLGKGGCFSDVIFRRDDPLPVFGQLVTLGYFGLKALLERKSLSEAMVDDFRWNGESIG